MIFVDIGVFSYFLLSITTLEWKVKGLGSGVGLLLLLINIIIVFIDIWFCSFTITFWHSSTNMRTRDMQIGDISAVDEGRRAVN
jgi:hypothetical protein